MRRSLPMHPVQSPRPARPPGVSRIRGGLGAVAACVVLATAGAAPALGSPETDLRRTLSSAMRGAGGGSGAYVLNATDRRTLFAVRADTPRVLASNTKLFTTAAALALFGEEGTLPTEVLGDGALDEDGVWRGDLYLRGGGDPTFGSASFTRRSYGRGTDVAGLARQLEEIVGIREVAGRVIGDESRFDSRRGGPDSAYGVSVYVGPLSALLFNRGLATEGGRGFQRNPPLYAASRLEAALEKRGVRVRGAPSAGQTATDATPLAAAQSPHMARLVQITNKRSDNLFAELLLKSVGVAAGRSGTTAAGAAATEAFARRTGARARLADGSGLSRGNRAAPRQVGRFLDRLREREDFDVFFDSLAVAGRDGTLHNRMRRGPARGRCRGKTGTLSGVSALSGYCRSRSGDTIVFSILMNGVNPAGARALQDRMAAAMVRYRG